MKFVIAQMKHETHSFVPETTALSSFNPFSGGGPLTGEAAVAACRGRNSAATGFVDVISAADAEFVVPVVAEAMPSGPVEDEAFEWMCGKIVAAVQEECDAVLLDLHGSMVTQNHADGEGELLKRIRNVAPEIPIGVALDFHCTLTDAIIDHATAITIYRTIPHVDMLETGERAARTILKLLQGKAHPVMAARRIPLMASLEKMDPTAFPMKAVMDRIFALETESNDILNASLSGGHPFTDCFPGGMTAVIIADGNRRSAEEAAEAVLQLAWQNREGFVERMEPYTETLKQALTLKEGPVIMADSGDIAASGGFAADTAVLEEAMHLGFEDMIAGPFHDPQSLRRMTEAGVGAEVTLDIGGKTAAPLLNYRGDSLRITGRVRALVEGRITATGPMLRGMTVSIGLMGVLCVGSIDILLTEQRIEALDIAVFTHVGLDPRERKYTLLKSRQHFKAAFGPIARHLIRIAGPGVTNPDFSTFPFKHIERPTFPLDPETKLKIVPMGSRSSFTSESYPRPFLQS